MLNEDTSAPETKEFLATIMDPKLDDFARKLRTDLIEVVHRDVTTFKLIGHVEGLLLIRAGVEVSRFTGLIASMCVIEAAKRAGPQSEEALKSCRKLLEALFKASIAAELELQLEKHLKQSD